MTHKQMNKFLQFLLLFSMSISTQLSAGQDYFGVWYGTVVEMVEAGKQYERYEVTISLVPGEYRIDYDSLGCGGKLQLQMQRGRFFRFKDDLNYGLEKCVSGGRTEIHFLNPGLAAFQWFDKNGVLKVEGHIRKQQTQLMI